MSARVFDEPWMQFKHPEVRQLAFAIASPNIINLFPDSIRLQHQIVLHPAQFWQQCFRHYLPRLQHLDQDPRELSAFLQQLKSTRLGLRFEALLWFWLQDPANLDFALLGHSLQFHHQGHTIGEIDFLVQNRHNQAIEHWEVSLKYYFASRDLDLECWYGLNPKDRFAFKLNHLNQQQFRFDDALGFAIQQRCLVLKGQLFVPRLDSAMPAWINQERRLGQLLLQIPQQQHGIRHLSRQEWLCPAHDTVLDVISTWVNGLYYQPNLQRYMMLYRPEAELRHSASRT